MQKIVKGIIASLLLFLLISTFSTLGYASQPGDVNEDGEINIFDMILLAEYIVGSTNEDISMEIADVNGDGVVDIHDMILIARYIVGEIDEFPVEVETDPPPGSLEINIDESITHQEIEGFGGSIAYYSSWLSDHPNKDEIYDLLFIDLGVDVLRLKNWIHDSRYGYQADQWDEDVEWDAVEEDFDYAAEDIVYNANERRDDPLKIKMTTWTPHPDLKSNNSPVGGTLRQENGNYVYDEYAEYWLESLERYSEIGIEPDYLSIQNEPDFETDYESCLFDPQESQNAASYTQAFEAVYEKLSNNLDEMPTMLGPDVVGIGYNNVQQYVDELDHSILDGIAFHLYHGGDNDQDPHPPSFSDNLNDLVQQYPDLPKYQTEFYRGDAFNTAWTMHTNLTEGNVSMYLYWDLIWAENGLITVENPWVDEPDYDGEPWTTEDGYWTTDSYYAVKHFAGYIEPGYQRVEASSEANDVEVSAYISPDEDSMTVVMLNTGHSQETVHLDIDGFSIISSEVYRTDWQNEETESISLGDGYSVEMPAESIVTVVLN